MQTMEDQIIAFCFMGLVGSVSLVYGILIRLEKIKCWWAIPYYAAGQEVFVAIPVGADASYLGDCCIASPRVEQATTIHWDWVWDAGSGVLDPQAPFPKTLLATMVGGQSQERHVSFAQGGQKDGRFSVGLLCPNSG